jgi:hypothetical protein
MYMDDDAFARRIIKEASSPRVAAECFAQEAESAGAVLTNMQRDVLLVLRYDDVVQVHGLALVLEDMYSDLDDLIMALSRNRCVEHEAELRRIVDGWSAYGKGDFTRLNGFINDNGSFDDVTLRLVQDGDAIRRRVLDNLRNRLEGAG